MSSPTEQKNVGRKKIKIQRIQDDRNRQVTFLKRKNGLLKKAMELGVLCDCEVSVVIFNLNNGKLFEYASVPPEQVFTRYATYTGPSERRKKSSFFELAAAKGTSDIPKNEPGLSKAAMDAASAAERRPRPINSAKGCSQVEPYPSLNVPIQCQENISNMLNQSAGAPDSFKRFEVRQAPTILNQPGDTGRFTRSDAPDPVNTDYQWQSQPTSNRPDFERVPSIFQPLTPRAATNHLSTLFGLQSGQSNVPHANPEGVMADAGPSSDTNGNMPSHNENMPPPDAPDRFEKKEDDECANVSHANNEDENQIAPSSKGSAVTAVNTRLPSVFSPRDENTGSNPREISPSERLNLTFLSKGSDTDFKLSLPSFCPSGLGESMASPDAGESRGLKRKISALAPSSGHPNFSLESSPSSAAFGLGIPAPNDLLRRKSSLAPYQSADGAGWGSWMPLGSGNFTMESQAGGGGSEYLNFNNDQLSMSTGDAVIMTPSAFIGNGNQFSLPSPSDAGLLPFSARRLFSKSEMDLARNPSGLSRGLG